METELNTVSDMNQMDMFDMQNAMQKEAQLMQILSNLSKMMHDTALAIIRKLG
jgi:hypothetical protein